MKAFNCGLSTDNCSTNMSLSGVNTVILVSSDVIKDHSLMHYPCPSHIILQQCDSVAKHDVALAARLADSEPGLQCLVEEI
jgi:hypothetical protein